MRHPLFVEKTNSTKKGCLVNILFFDKNKTIDFFVPILEVAQAAIFQQQLGVLVSYFQRIGLFENLVIIIARCIAAGCPKVPVPYAVIGFINTIMAGY